MKGAQIITQCIRQFPAGPPGRKSILVGTKLRAVAVRSAGLKTTSGAEVVRFRPRC